MPKIFKKKKSEKTIKVLKKHFAVRFQKTVELVQSGILNSEDARLFVENEPTVSFVLQEIKKKKSDELNRAANKAILTRDKTLIDVNLETVTKERAVLYNEFTRLMFTEPVNAAETLHKQTELNYLRERIRACDIILDDLNNCKIKNFKVSRGRPEKKEEKTIFELAKEIKEVDSEGLSVDDRIMSLLRQFSAEKKKYLFQYMKTMLEVNEALEKNI